MVSKKATKPRAKKQPKKITGLEASLISFRARNGAILPADAIEFEGYVSPHVRKIVFEAKRKSKTGQKTLERIRKVAEANVRGFSVSTRRAAAPSR